jgi:PAS domain S-box-containing protein
MSESQNLPSMKLLRGLSRATGLFVAAVAFLSIVERFVTNGSYFVLPMKDTTAFCLLFSGLVLYLLWPSSERPRVAATWSCIAALAALALLVLIENLVDRDLGLTSILPTRSSGGTAVSGRMAATSASYFLLVATSLTLLKLGRAVWVVNFFAIILIIGSLSAITRIVYELATNAATSATGWTAMPVTVAFLLVGFGLITARPDEGICRLVLNPGVGGRVARRFLPTVVLLPFAMALLRLGGQRVGLGGDLWNAAVGLLNIAVLSMIVVWSAAALSRLDAYREEALRAKRAGDEWFRLFVSCAKDYAIVMFDPDGNVLNWNPGASKIMGYTEKEILGGHFSCFYTTEEVNSGKPAEDLREALSLGRYERECQRVRNDGILFWANIVITALRSEEGRLLGFAEVVRDVTERHRAEEALLQRSEELAESNRHLDEKNRENEMFVYSVSHDLRSPLVNLQGFGNELAITAQELRELLSDETTPQPIRERGHALLNDGVEESIRFIQSGVLRLSSIIDALLRLSRAGRVEYRVQTVDLDNIAGRIVEAMHGTIQEKGASVTLQPLGRVRGDPTALEQVYANLIGNALNYLSPERPGAISVGRVSSPEGDATGLVTYFVKDNGVGIAEAYRGKLFQAFQRLNPKAAPGEGIGLALVRRAVERHRGRVWFDSSPGVGTTFYVTLPGESSVGGAGVEDQAHQLG